jgi:hypothetical protein
MQSLQILYTYVLRAEVATIFGPNVVGISARNTKVYKLCELCKARYFPHFTTFRNQTLQLYFTNFSMLFLAIVIYLHLLA